MRCRSSTVGSRSNGIDNLRIADGSILPRVTTGNTMAPCVIIGEKAANFIKSELGFEAQAEGRSWVAGTPQLRS